MSVRKKVFWTSIVLVLVAGVCMSLASIVQSKRTEAYVRQANEQTVLSLSSYTQENLDQVGAYMIDTISSDYAKRIESNFGLFENTVISISNFATALYGDTQDRRREALPPSLVMPKVDFAAVEQEYYQVRPIIPYMKSLNYFKEYPGVDMYMLTESGIYFDGTGIKGVGAYPRDLRGRDWYTGAVEADGIYWAEVYIGATTGQPMITCSYPVYYEGRLEGVAAIDIPVSIIGDSVLEVDSEFVTDICILNGDFLVDYSLSDSALPAAYLEQSKDELAHFKNLLAGGKIVEDEYEDYSVALIPVPDTKWTVAVFFQFNQIELAAGKIVRAVEDINARTMSDISGQMTRNILIQLVILAVVLVVTILIARQNSRRLVRPIEQLVKQAKEVGVGRLDHKMEVIHSGDELEEIMVTFNDMTSSLQTYIANLEHVTAEKNRVQTELTVATKIQKSMLPNIFPPFPNRKEFDLHALMEPARQVGGDFYDFFLIDDNRLALVIADVSGKGIGAALFMVIAKTVIKNIAQTHASPAQILSQANNTLCTGNDAAMFVTCFLGVLEIDTGVLTCANAGHNPPLLISGAGGIAPLDVKPGFVLAGMEGMRYTETQVAMQPGQKLLLYTDGVTEAFNPHGEQYGMQRLEQTLEGLKDADIKQMIQGVRADIDLFAEGEEQADDITMLVLRYDGQTGEGGTRRFEADVARLEGVMAFVQRRLERAGCPPKTVMQVQLVVEEVFVNVAHYAYGDRQGWVDVTCEVEQYPDRVVLEFRDGGTPFDPTQKPDPDASLPGEARDIGGLGIFMAKKLVDSMEYRHENGQNILRMEKRLEG